MAYTPLSDLQDPNKEDQNQQPPSAPAPPTISGTSLGSTPSFGGTAGNVGAGGLAQQGSQENKTNSAPQAGTGFVNIDKVLEANKNAGQQLNQTARQAMTTERHNFNGGFNQIMAGINSQGAPQGNGSNTPDYVGNIGINKTKYQVNPNYLSYQEAFPDKKFNGPIYTPIAGSDDRTEAINAAKGAFKNYQGPDSYDYNIGGSKEAQFLRSLSSPQSIAPALAALNGPMAKYNTGMSAIDQAIYGSNAMQPILNSINQDSSGILQDEANRMKIASDAATAKKGEISAYNDQLKSKFMDRANQLKGVLGSGSGTQADQNTLNAIAQVLGDPTLSNFPIAPPKPVDMPNPPVVQDVPPEPPVPPKPEHKSTDEIDRRDKNSTSRSTRRSID